MSDGEDQLQGHRTRTDLTRFRVRNNWLVAAVSREKDVPDGEVSVDVYCHLCGERFPMDDHHYVEVTVTSTEESAL